MDPIVITTHEVDRAQIPVQGAPEIRPKVPIWTTWTILTMVLLAPLILVLPLICLAALIVMVSVRGRTPRLRQIWSSYLLTVLIISGFWSTAVMVVGVSLSWAPAPDVVGAALSGLDERNNFPVLPTHKIMSGVELSTKLKPMVLLASPAAKRWFRDEWLGYGPGRRPPQAA